MDTLRCSWIAFPTCLLHACWLFLTPCSCCSPPCPPPDGAARIAGPAAQGSRLCAGGRPQPAAPAGHLQGGRGGWSGRVALQAPVRRSPAGVWVVVGGRGQGRCRLEGQAPGMAGRPPTAGWAALGTYAAHMPQVASTCRLSPLQAVVTLPVQYRMAADIMALPNALIYGDALRCGTGGWPWPGCHRALLLRTSLCRAAVDTAPNCCPPQLPLARCRQRGAGGAGAAARCGGSGGWPAALAAGGAGPPAAGALPGHCRCGGRSRVRWGLAQYGAV